MPPLLNVELPRPAVLEQIVLPSDDEIAARAYELFVQRDRVDGHDIDDWLEAETELLNEAF